MRGAARSATNALTGGRNGLPEWLFTGKTAGTLLLAVICSVLFWTVSLYASALRDPRYLDGWVLAGGMVAQLLFHVALRKRSGTPKSFRRWRAFHIMVGYVLIGAFLSHSDFSLPDTTLEWSLSMGFVLVTLSGLFGTYLSWSVKAKHGISDGISFERIAARREEIAREVQDAAMHASQPPEDHRLPPLPYDSWIADLYANHLMAFLEGPGQFTAHLFGSQRRLKRVTGEIDMLMRYVDAEGQKKLAAIRELVVEKDRLDYARVYLGLTKGWLYVHLPVTYGLVVLTVLHGIVVYAFSSGAW